MFYKRMSVFTLIFLCIILQLTFFLFPAPALSEPVKKILILPFSFNSDENQDLKFLEKGIYRMLHTRLRHPDLTEIQFLKPGSSGISNPSDLGIKSGADYVLTGSITMFGEKISTDASLFDIKNNKEILTFGEFGKTKGDAIEHINSLAEKINADVFNIKPEVPVSEQALLVARKNYGLHAAPVFGTPKGFRFKSKRIDAEIRSIAIGDVNGDKQNELIYAEKNTIKAVTFNGAKQTIIAEKKLSAFLSILRIYTFDIDKDGKDEIYVNAENTRMIANKPLVLIWNRTKEFEEISLPSTYFYAVHSNEFDLPKLTAQKRTDQERYLPPAYEVDFDGSDFTVSNRKMAAPRHADLFSFATGKFYNDERMLNIYFSTNFSYAVADKSGYDLWETGTEFSDGPIFAVSKPPDLQEKGNVLHHYLPPRINAEDLDNDGKKDVILINNKLSSLSVLERVRTYQHGKMMVYSNKTEERGLQKQWESIRYPGVISDCAVGDMNNDGKIEIIFSIIQKNKGFLDSLSKSKSTIVAHGFN